MAEEHGAFSNASDFEFIEFVKRQKLLQTSYFIYRE